MKISAILLLAFALFCQSAVCQRDINGVSPGGLDECDEATVLLGIGSSTVFPVAELYARSFVSDDTLAIVKSTGSSLGLRNLLVGAVPIGHSSRALTGDDYTAADCPASGVGADGVATELCQGVLPVGIQIASDVIGIVVHPDNNWASALTTDQVNSLFSGSQTWQAALGSSLGAPDTLPDLIIPDPLSGTYQFFADAVVEPAGSNIQYFSSDIALIEAVAANTNAIGFVGAAYLNSTSVKVIPVNNINPATTSTPDQYFLFRPLFMYYNDNESADNPLRTPAQQYICGLLRPEGQAVVSTAGALPLSQSVLDTQRTRLGCDTVETSSTGGATPQAFGAGNSQFQFCKDAVKIVQIGSSTVFPIVNLYSDLNSNPYLLPWAASAGSDVGLESLLAGGADIATASRAIRAEDYDAFDCNGTTGIINGTVQTVCQDKLPRGVLIGRDLLSIIVSPQNTIIPSGSGVTVAQLSQLFTSGTSWATALGNSATGTPDLCAPDRNSGTRDFFESTVGDDVTVEGYSNDTAILDCVANNPNAIGFAPFATVENNDAVRILPVNDVTPAIGSTGYPLERPLYLYYDVLSASTQVLDYICGLLSPKGRQIVQYVGYVPLSDAEVNAQLGGKQLLCRFNLYSS